MHVLEKQGQRLFIDGRHFHLFPGLTWNGTIEGKKSEVFFASCFGEILRTNLGSEPLKILIIDTTNSGNAVNNAVAACQKAFDASGASPSNFLLKVIGVVNSSHSAAQLSSSDKSVVTGVNRTAHVFTPSGYATTSNLIDRQFTSFSPLASDCGCSVEVSYWLAGKIPTEDNYKLIGVEAVHKSLATKAEPIAGRLEIVYRNGEIQQETGLGNLSSFLISLLSMPLDSIPWQKMQSTNDLLSHTEVESNSQAELREISQGGLRLFELEPFRVFDRHSAETSDIVKGLLNISRPLNDVEVYWLGNLNPTPRDRDIALKVCASLEKGKCTKKEALKYFCSAFPELTAADPGGNGSAEWWDNQIRSLPKKSLCGQKGDH